MIPTSGRRRFVRVKPSFLTLKKKTFSVGTFTSLPNTKILVLASVYGSKTLDGNEISPSNCPDFTIFSRKSFIDLSLRTASGTIILALDFELLFFNDFSICKIDTEFPFLIYGLYN